MNSSSTPDLSLLQLLQRQAPTLKPFPLGWATFEQITDGILGFLRDRNLRATLWVKLPSTAKCDRAIDTYYQSGLADRIYQCHLAKSSPAASVPLRTPKGDHKRPAPDLIPLVLEASTHLKREYFVLVLSPQLCLLVLVHEQAESSAKATDSDSNSMLPLRGIYSFSPSLITDFLAGIRQSLTITDSTPEELLSDSVLAFPLPTAIDADLISELTQQQWQYLEGITTQSPVASISEPTSPAEIVLNAEFLKQLTRELSLPLTNMKTALRLLDSMQHKREQRQRYLSLLQKECDRQSFLLTGLQEMVEINQGHPENLTSVKLEDLVPGIVSTYQPLAEEKGIMLGYTVPAGLPPIACSSAWLRQILRNLLYNSLKFTPAKGRVYVQADHKQDSIELVVSDTGVGIENRDLPHIFEPFFRGRNLPSAEVEGVGLGLMVVKQLIDQCHGSISVYSKPHKGTQIKLTFPLFVA